MKATVDEIKKSPDWQAAFVIAGSRARESITGRQRKFEIGDVYAVESIRVGTNDRDLSYLMGLFKCRGGKKRLYVFIKAGCRNWGVLAAGSGAWHVSRNVLVADMKVEDCEDLGVAVNMTGAKRTR